MTWSLIARGADGRFGVVIASRFFAVGALCVHTSPAGALATQALMNPLYGGDGLARLAAGEAPEAIVAALTAADAGRDQRQLHLIGTAGSPAVHTGEACVGWCGHRLGDDYSVAGNMLAGPEVVDETVRVWLAGADLPLAQRLIAAMAAGQAAGGDKRGQQSAALRIQAAEDYPALDIRVDDHPTPLGELERLHAVSLERFQPFVACLARRDAPAGITDRSALEAEIQRQLASQGDDA